MEKLKKIRLTDRILSFIILVLILPFYVGYGLPIPNLSEYTFLENLWLIIMPLFLLGMIISFKFEKTGGYIISIPILIGFLSSLFLWQDPSPIMALPLIPGILFIVYDAKLKKIKDNA